LNLLKNFKVIDFTHRLPGPLAGKIFTDLGAKVIKVEDQTFKDPFIQGFFNQSDSQFKTWYEELNKDKELERFDFKSEEAFSIFDDLLKDANVLLLAQPQKILEKFMLTPELLKSRHPNLTVMQLIAGEGKYKNLHDLNALAMAGLLDMHLFERKESITAPPFLPVAGISFGHWVVTKSLAAVISKENWVVASLQEATKNILSPFRSQSDSPKFLHNGKFPCYSLYRTKDKKTLAIAAVEEKFWIKFTELFDLKIPVDQRFDTSKKTFKIISEKVQSLGSSEIKNILQDQDICLTLV
jgi:crotonobetainyl-CoA:carnitine CoA-transferase CaiB-like acyl-CoA transferase